MGAVTGLLTFLRARRGAAALEFALCAGFVFTLAIGVSELHFRMQASQQVTQAALRTADLVAQAQVHSAASLQDVRAATRTALRPLPSNGVSSIEVALLCVRNAGETARVAWRDPSAGSTPIDLAAATPLIDPGGSVVWVAVNYAYSSPIEFLFSRNRTFSKYAFARPRQSLVIPLNNTWNCPS